MGEARRAPAPAWRHPQALFSRAAGADYERDRPDWRVDEKAVYQDAGTAAADGKPTRAKGMADAPR